MDNNLEKYTDGFEFPKMEDETPNEIKPVPLEPIYEEAPVETYEDVVNNKKIEDKKEYNEINENPNAKITLNKSQEVEEEVINPKDIKIDFKGNKSLIRVLVIGLILFVIICLLPLLKI